ncbi:MAG: phosphoribosylglycinamide formyltransferase [Chloroflexota bacterium]
MSKPKLIVFVSGSGSNLQALIDAIDQGDLDAQIIAVVSNKAKAYGLERARAVGIPTVYFPYKPYREAGREAYDVALLDALLEFDPDLIVLAGWMRIFSTTFLNQFPNQIINLHPALPGTYIGAHGLEWTMEAYQKGEIEHGGAMVHYAIPAVDEGEPIATVKVPIYADDSLEDYAQRLHAAEHTLIVQATKIALGQ